MTRKTLPSLVRMTVVAMFFSLIGAVSSSHAADIDLISRTTFSVGESQPGYVGFLPDGSSFSADGRWMVFESGAAAVVPGIVDRNGVGDVFLKDLVSGELRLVSAAAGAPNRTAERGASQPRISADGSFVFYISNSYDLVLSEPLTLLLQQIYRYDVATRTTRLVTHVPGQSLNLLNVENTPGPVSADGRYTAFATSASDLAPGTIDENEGPDLYLWDANSDTFALISHVPGNPQMAPSSRDRIVPGDMSPDGRFITYSAESNGLTLIDTNFASDVFLYDRLASTSILVSHALSSPTTTAIDASDVCSMSPDGRFVLFTSKAYNLTAAFDSNQEVDLFLFDRNSGIVELISGYSSGGNLYTGNASSSCGSLSADGRYIFFPSRADNLVSGILPPALGENGYLLDRQAGILKLVTRQAGSPDTFAGNFIKALATADFSSLVMVTRSTEMVGGTTYPAGIFFQPAFAFSYDLGLDALSVDLKTIGQPTTAAPVSFPNAMSPDGAFVLYHSFEPTPATGAVHREPRSQQAVLHDRGTQSASLLTPTAYSHVGSGARGTAWDSPGGDAVLSADARYIAFASISADLCSATFFSLCFFDRQTGASLPVNHAWNNTGMLTSEESYPVALSQDGRWLLLYSLSPVMAPTDNNTTWDLALYDTFERQFQLISHAAGNPGTAANGSSEQPRRGVPGAMTPDAGKIVFQSQATDLVMGATDSNNTSDVFFLQRGSEFGVLLVSHVAGNPLLAADGPSTLPQFATAGRYLIFESTAGNLVNGFIDGNAANPDLYLYDTQTRSQTLVSHVAGSPLQGSAGLLGEVGSVLPKAAISADGRFVAFTSSGADLIGGGIDTNSAKDVVVFDRTTGNHSLISHADGLPTTAANGGSSLRGLSADGRFVLFISTATNLMPGSLPTAGVLYLRDRQDGSLRRVSHRKGDPSIAVWAQHGALAPDGSRAFFLSSDFNVVPIADPPYYNFSTHLYSWERATDRIELLTYKHNSTKRLSAGSVRAPFAVTPDGKSLLFTSGAPDLVGNDANQAVDLFLALSPTPIFQDGFESGSTSAWSQTTP